MKIENTLRASRLSVAISCSSASRSSRVTAGRRDQNQANVQDTGGSGRGVSSPGLESNDVAGLKRRARTNGEELLNSEGDPLQDAGTTARTSSRHTEEALARREVGYRAAGRWWSARWNGPCHIPLVKTDGG